MLLQTTGIIFLAVSISGTFAGAPSQNILSKPKPNLQCPLPEPREPSADDGHHPSSDFWSNATLERQIERLSAVVAVPSVCYDDLGDFDHDERWRSFEELHRTLERLFPLTHERASLTKVNRFGLIYTIQGTSSDLLPIMFSAHQDVVPAQSLDTWTHPPFQPHYDGKYLWGRGSCDCKNNLIGTLSAVEELLSNDEWKPRRTIILAYGFDEEANGYRGAAKIAEVLESTWGKDGIALIFDEGGMGLDTRGDAIYALPAVHEKSSVEIFIELQIQGGHASKPPPHSGIGIMSEVVLALEAHPYEAVLLKGSPYYQHLVCQAVYSPEEDPWLSEALENDDLEFVAQKIVTMSPEIRFRIQTSQAVDLITGGAKINALPETVSIGVDYRVAQHDSIEDIKANIIAYVTPIIEKYGLNLQAWTGDTNTTNGIIIDSVEPRSSFLYNGTLNLVQGDWNPHTPISPTLHDSVWDEFSATVRHVYSQYAKTVVPVGDIMNGNTDTRHYWSLSKNIYRWSPSRLGTRVNVHGTDERLDISAHIDGLRLYYDLIRNFDVWEGSSRTL